MRQGIRALHPRIPAEREEVLAAMLTEPQADAFRALPAADQAHLLRVFHILKAGGVHDRDLLTAALLHDLGKVAPDGRVRLMDRVLCVLLGRLAPAMLTRLAGLPAPAWRRGLALAVHHAELGAGRVAALGGSDRTCWLIDNHHTSPLPAEPDLRRLVAADRAAG